MGGNVALWWRFSRVRRESRATPSQARDGRHDHVKICDASGVRPTLDRRMSCRSIRAIEQVRGFLGHTTPVVPVLDEATSCTGHLVNLLRVMV